MGEDVADGKSSRPWAMHGKPPGRPAGPSIEYTPIVPLLPPLTYPPERALDGAWRSFPISKGDQWLILLEGKVGLWGL